MLVLLMALGCLGLEIACSKSNNGGAETPPSGTSGAAAGAQSGGASGTNAGSGGTSAGNGGTTAGGGSGGGSSGAGGTASGSGGSAGVAYNPCPTTASSAPCIILPLGDSITDGYGEPGGYRVELFRMARAANRRITFVGSLSNGPATVDGATFPQNHEGHSGIRIQPLGEDFVPSPGLRTQPHIVLLMIGANDMDQDDVATAPRRLGVLVDDVLAAYPNALLVLAQLTPVAPPLNPSIIPTYNAAMPALVQQRAAAGKHIILVDMYSGYPLSELLDDVHPNEDGFRRIAGVWYAAIRHLLP